MVETPLLALRVDDDDYALEPGRVLLLGSGADCDLRLPGPGVTQRHARVWASPEGAAVVPLSPTLLLNGVALHGPGDLRAGDCLRLGDVELRIVRDHGQSLILPVPELVAARTAAAPAAAPTVPPPPPAARPHRPRRSAAALPLRRSSEATFADLMADELRRAPWFSISLVGHLVLILLLLWFMEPPPAGGRDSIRVGIAQAETPGEPSLPPDAASKEQVAAEESAPEKLPEMAAPEEIIATFDDDRPLVSETERDRGLLQLGANIVGRKNDANSRGGGHDDAILGAAGAGNPEFRRTVSELRATGLEIVFVLDSTGSMSSVIEEAQTHIADMLDVLRALVPDARFGFVVFRDQNPREEYLTRALPLGNDFWRLANFTSSIEAGGGGDRPEAVREGLQTAFGQDWRRSARRVVVLAGDAPPHPGSQGHLMREVRAFCSDGKSVVHTVVTDRRGLRSRGQHDTTEAFQLIAQNGHGVCTDLSDRAQVLQRVLSLAFGQEYQQDLDEVYRRVRARIAATDSRSLDTARRGGEALRQALSEVPVRSEVVQALTQRPRRAVAAQLVDLLADRELPESGRQAASHVLQRVLELPRPPLDPVAGGTAGRNQRDTLTELVQRLPK